MVKYTEKDIANAMEILKEEADALPYDNDHCLVALQVMQDMLAIMKSKRKPFHCPVCGKGTYVNNENGLQFCKCGWRKEKANGDE